MSFLCRKPRAHATVAVGDELEGTVIDLGDSLWGHYVVALPDGTSAALPYLDVEHNIGALQYRPWKRPAVKVRVTNVNRRGQVTVQRV